MSQSTDAYSRTPATIAGSAAVSNSISMVALGLVGAAIIVPNPWTAADIGFEVSMDGETWYPLQDAEGARVKITGITTNAGKVYIAPAEVWAIGAFPNVRLASLNTSGGANINQAAERELTFVRLAT